MEKKRETLKSLILKNQHLLESSIKDEEKAISLILIVENAEIVKSIKTLFSEEKQIRKDLYVLAEEVFLEENRNHLLSK